MDKIIDPSLAARAYSNNLNVGTKAPVKSDDGVSFSSFLKDKIGDSIDTMHKGEELSAKAVTDDADITDVVQAVTSAEVTLQTVVAIRDRLVSAYQEILRMPI